MPNTATPARHIIVSLKGVPVIVSAAKARALDLNRGQEIDLETMRSLSRLGIAECQEARRAHSSGLN